VDAAVAWYAGTGRISVSPDRDTALDATVAGWAADVAGGSHAAMYAWRRANVAELNRRGRQAWDGLGKLSGPGLVVGNTEYRAGDRIVTLAPGAKGEIVTSECGTVAALDVNRRELGATMDDGRFQRIAGNDLDAEHLAHGYAVTVHRSQGSTVDRAHALEDGGGRELAYVKMSRARERSVVYVVADSVDQAVEDLNRSWSVSRRIGWAIDRGTPARHADVATSSPQVDGEPTASVRHARLVAEREALATVVPADPGLERSDVQGRVRTLEAELEDLNRAEGTGAWRDTPVGEAAIAWKEAHSEWRWCSAQADRVGLRERHRLLRRADRAADREGPLREAFQRLATPERARILAELPDAKKLLDDLDRRYYGHMRFGAVHPEAIRRLDRLDAQIAATGRDLDIERQGLDGIPPAPLPSPGHQRGIERHGPVLEREIGLEIGR